MHATLVPAALLAACTPDEEVVVDLEATAAPSAHVPSVAHVAVSGADAGAVFVEFGLDGTFASRTPAGVHHLLGLKAGRRYDWRAVAIDADGVRHESPPGTFDVPLPPPDLYPFTVTVDEAEAEVAWVLASVIRNRLESWAVILDRDGDPVWWAAAGGTLMTTPELGLDGQSVTWSEADFGKAEDRGQLERVSLDGSHRVETRLRTGHHDAAERDDGTVAFLGQTFAEVPAGDQGTVTMVSDTISLVPEGAGEADEPVVLFDQFRDFPLDPAPTCEHVTERADRLGRADVAEWTHGNSLVFLPEAGAYYVLDKYTDWLFAVDAATGGVRWVLNGRGSDFTRPDGRPVWNAPDQTALWSHGHLSDLWDGGALVFDNADHRPGPSRAVEVAWDAGARTAEIVWAFDHPRGDKTPALGDVRRMPGGNVLITWSGLGSITEVTRDGRVVWEAAYPGDDVERDGQTIGRIVPLEVLYR